MLIFVYGTLLSNLRLSYVLFDSDYLGKAIGIANLYDLGHFPGIKIGDGKVLGEIYRVSTLTLKELDSIEGYYPSEKVQNCLYIRSKIQLVSAPFSDPVYAYFYNLSIEKMTPIENGDYKKHIQAIV